MADLFKALKKELKSLRNHPVVQEMTIDPENFDMGDRNMCFYAHYAKHCDPSAEGLSLYKNPAAMAFKKEIKAKGVRLKDHVMIASKMSKCPDDYTVMENVGIYVHGTPKQQYEHAILSYVFRQVDKLDKEVLRNVLMYIES